MTAGVDRTSALIFLAIVVSTVALGMIYSAFLGATLRYPDEREYVAIAGNVLSQGFYSIDGMTATARRPPVWPMMLLLSQLVVADLQAARVLNFVLLALSGIALFLLVRQLDLSAKAALATAAAYVMYPLNIYTAGTLYPQTLQGLLVLALLGAGLARHRRSAILFGIASGLAILTAPASILVVPLAWALTAYLDANKRTLSFVAVAATGCGLLLAPWVLRNAISLNAFVPVSTTGGENFLLGNNPRTTPAAGVNQDISFYLSGTANLSEVEKDRSLGRQAIALVLQQPLHYAGLYVRKFLNWFNFQNTLYVSTEASLARSALAFVSYYGLLICSSISLLLVSRLQSYEHLRRPLRVVALLYVGSGLAHAIFFTRVRFRIPFDGLLFLLAAPLFEQVLIRWRAGSSRWRPGRA
jgi:hypothetical protein